LCVDSLAQSFLNKISQGGSATSAFREIAEMESGKLSDSVSKIQEYKDRAFVVRRGHHLASNFAERKNLRLGVPVVAITALVGTSIFGTTPRQSKHSDQDCGWCLVDQRDGACSAADLLGLQRKGSQAQRGRSTLRGRLESS
jgi:hypothetical protein